MDEFKKLGLSDTTIDAITKKGFKTPSDIQAKTIPVLLKGEHDVVAQAQTGTGKTACFALPILESLTKQKKVQALVFVGDCMEEDVDRLCQIAGELGMLGVPAFLFHEGAEPVAQRTFKQIARLTRGAYCSFDATSAGQLRDLLKAVAIYAAGGQSALQDFSKDGSGLLQKLTRQLGKD